MAGGSFGFLINNLQSCYHLRGAMKKIIFLMFLLCIASVTTADVLCVKNRVRVRADRVNLANKVRVVEGSSCPQRYSLVKDLDEIQDQRITAFAKIAGDGSVLSFGGTDVTGVSVSQPSVGRFEITFVGNFDLPSTSDPTQNASLFTAVSSAVADNYGSTNNAVESATATEIAATVFLWRSDSLADQYQSGINIIIMQGAAPLS